MKILIVGSGAREHTIGEKVSKSKMAEKIYFAPGNGGTVSIGENVNIQGNDIEGLVNFAKSEGIDFTIVGPEDPLNLGIVDEFENEGLKIFGPTKAAAKLEGSKAFAKDFMIKHGIPTGKYIKTEDHDNAIKFAKLLLETNGKAVIKADGLCAGKGVFIVSNEKEANDYLEQILVKGNYGEKKVIIEEFLEGYEMSLIAFVDNKTIKMLPTSKDHKRIFEGERGANTGGMGTFSPNLEAENYLEEIEESILNPFLKGIQEDNLDFRGIIFIGLMIGDNGIKVLEFNTRFGDPETQSILNRIDSDLLDIMLKTNRGDLASAVIDENDKKVVTLVLASGGYPEEYKKGYEIKGLDKVEDVIIYHAGTKVEEGKIITNGGRVLSIVAIEDDFEKAIEKVYKTADIIEFEDKFYRKDIGPSVNRYYVEKNENIFYDYISMRESIITDLEFDPGDIRMFSRYDIEGLNGDLKETVVNELLADAHIEKCYAAEDAFKLEKELKNPLVVEFQPGQFDQSEYATIKNLELLSKSNDIRVRTSKVYAFSEELDYSQKEKLEEYIINKTNQRKGKLLGVPSTLNTDNENYHINDVYYGFTKLDEVGLNKFLLEHGLAMSLEDLKFVQDHYKEIGRDINETELYILDTYWSDHCRHTTFNTILDVEFKDNETLLDKRIHDEFNNYIKMRQDLNRTKPISLMDLGTIVARYLKFTGDLDNQEDTDEVNACSIEIKVKVEDRITKEIREEDYLLMFKNETHNHPTEIEPYGGAHTCIGGGIRDPLSGRAHVYQAMRITGAGDPTIPYKDTLKGKLPQRKIAIDASEGYSSYGNEIGLAAGFADEIYHEGFVAKRMELGALVGAQKKENVLRENSEPGDIILLLGAKTGRDGVGAATGSSSQQTADVIEEASTEVQRGNPPLERNIMRLFRNPEATKLIKKSNDFGAGGVSVAIGELADSLDIYLDRVPLKYPGLTPKEIAISESQERMAVVIDAENKNKFIELSEDEGIETTEVAVVTDKNKMVMYYRDQVVCELDRTFLDASGADRFQKIVIEKDKPFYYFEEKGKELGTLYENLSDLNYVSKKDLIGKFDSTIGRGTILAPLGGINQITPIQAMAAIIPSLDGNSKTASIMSYGYDPVLSSENQFLGGYYAVVESLAKIAATGGNPFKARLSFQEFFESMGTDEIKWAKPLKSLLGAFYATREFKTPPIGGKDSMSGTFQDLDVPPTLISFAVVSEDAKNIISPELKGKLKLGIIKTNRLEDYTLNHEEFMFNVENLYKEIKSGNIKSAYAINYKGLLHNLMEMSLGNEIGFVINFEQPFDNLVGSFIVEYENSKDFIEPIGLTGGDSLVFNGEKIDVERFKETYENSLIEIYPQEIESNEEIGRNKELKPRNLTREERQEDVKVLIPIFPGTTGEYDVEEVLLENQAIVTKFVFKNETINQLEESIEKLAEEIEKSNIIIFPSGMTYGDEPEGAGKYLANVLRQDKIKKAILDLIDNRDGLILGIGDGFQGLVRTGLIPFGTYIKFHEELPVFAKNSSGRYSSKIVETIFKTNNSPWLKYVELEKEYLAPISTYYGQLILPKDLYRELSNNEQIVSVYNKDTLGADYSIEGLMDPKGRILGKMTNFERIKDGTLINIPKTEFQDIIKAGIEYFRK
ncbi:MAG: phosphoribosylformylglycinamidine synthase [Tissierellia bacterium]|nr:phosphoribosylformylglycinamidine synthase [Tissierellia bacterium]